MQQDARNFQATAAKDREADRQEMLRRTAAPQPTPGTSHLEPPHLRLPYPPADFGVQARQLPPYPIQGYSGPPSSQVSRTQGLPAPPPVQPTGPPGSDLRWGRDLHRLQPFTVCCSNPIHQRRAAQESWPGPSASAASGGLLKAGKPHPQRSGASRPRH